MVIAKQGREHSSTLSDEVTEQLRTAVRDGLLQPGERLVEREIAARLKVSRVPVREAMQRLVEEGLLSKIPHRGTFIYVPTRDEIEEISFLRVVLERYVAERVIERWQSQHEETLRNIVQQMRTDAAKRDLQQLYAHDYQFHLTLWQIADQTIMLEVLTSLRARINRFLYEANDALPTEQIAMHVDGHDDLIDVLKSGDTARAVRMFTQHVVGAKERILAYCNLPGKAVEQ
ncbi:MAG TPA: GntR family transcriptional regulator [Caldilineaceae bacterium]|nr:GntR family transcriptional regulator [Caldilineaceae bacterium]